MHVESVSILLADGIQLPLYLACVVTVYVLVLLPVPSTDVGLIPSQVASQSVQLPQDPTQLTGQFVFMHVVSNSSVLVTQLPPYSSSFNIVYVLVLLPVLGIDVVFLPSQVASHSVQLLQVPMQSTGQFVFTHVLSVSFVPADGVQVPLLIAAFNTLYVLVLLPA